MKFDIGKKQRIDSKDAWLKGMKVDEKEGRIYTWNQVRTFFNDLNSKDKKMIYKFKGLTPYEDYITDLITSDIYKYFITSTYKGSILVWKLS